MTTKQLQQWQKELETLRMEDALAVLHMLQKMVASPVKKSAAPKRTAREAARELHEKLKAMGQLDTEPLDPSTIDDIIAEQAYPTQTS